MRKRKIAMLAVLAVALAIPGVSLAKKEDKHGIGKGGVPALRDYLQDQIDSLLRRVRRVEKAVEILQTQFADADGDGSYVLVPDCDDDNADVSPNVDEIPGNLVDDNCDGQVDEAV